MAHQKITEEIKNVLQSSRIEGNLLFLPDAILTRKLYMQVNAVLENLGGKWNRYKKAHVFEGNPADALAKALDNGESIDKKVLLQAFYTPREIAVIVAEKAEVKGCLVFEPSAGHGALADACREHGAKDVHCVEIDNASIDVLRRKNYQVWTYDFLTIPALDEINRYKRIVMNPPFTKGAYLKHLKHALEGFLCKGGILVSVIPGDIENPRFQALIAPYRHIINLLPTESFKNSGTSVSTAMLKVWK